MSKLSKKALPGGAMLSRPSFGLKWWFWLFNFPNGIPLRGYFPYNWTETMAKIQFLKQYFFLPNTLCETMKYQVNTNNRVFPNILGYRYNIYQDLSYGELLAAQPGAWLVKKICFLCMQ